MTVKKIPPGIRRPQPASVTKSRPKTNGKPPTVTPPQKLPAKFQPSQPEPERPDQGYLSLPTGEKYPLLLVPKEKMFLFKEALKQGFEYAGTDKGYHVFVRSEHKAMVQEIFAESKKGTSEAKFAYTILKLKWE